MKRAAADAELFGGSGDVAVGRIYQDLTFRLHALNETSPQMRRWSLCTNRFAELAWGDDVDALKFLECE
jgi:hypothetical protein